MLIAQNRWRHLWPAPRPDPPSPCLLPAILTFGEDRGLAAPPFLTCGGQGVNGVVILVEALERLRIVGFDAGAIILGPVGDAFFTVVVLHLMNPTLADKGHIANHPWCGKAGQVPHDVVLQLLGFLDG